MKAILVVDIPDDVEIEDCEIEYSVKEQVMLIQVAKGKTKLKPMPQKKGKYGEPHEYDTDIHYEIGWNECIAKITGETEWKQY